MRDRAIHRSSALALVGLLAVVVVGLVAATPAPVDRARDLDSRLRCPVCTSVSIAESDSQTALAMRAEVADQIAAGRTDREIIDYFRARYGDWVLLDPPTGGVTAAVWILPLGGAAVAGVLLLALVRRGQDPAPEVSEEARQQVEAAAQRWRRTAEEDEP